MLQPLDGIDGNARGHGCWDDRIDACEVLKPCANTKDYYGICLLSLHFKMNEVTLIKYTPWENRLAVFLLVLPPSLFPSLKVK